MEQPWNFVNVISISGFMFIAFILTACIDDHKSQPQDLEILGIAKWYNNYSSAYTPTYDAGTPAQNKYETDWLIENGLLIDYEIVSANYDRYPFLVDQLLELIEHSFGYFGHGHYHDYHDTIGYDRSYLSFRQNFESIQSYGLTPVAYAYPYGAGQKPETRQALSDAGFYSGRLFQPVFEEYGPYILPYDEMEPVDWFALPSLTMQDIEFNNCTTCVNNPAELLEHLIVNIDKRSWLISTYHAIGFDGQTDGRPVGWGFYTRDNFFQDMTIVKTLMATGDLWLVSMADATRYIKQRNGALYTLQQKIGNEYTLYLGVDVDLELFNHPMTLEISATHDLIGNFFRVYSPQNELVSEFEITTQTFFVNLEPINNYYTIQIGGRP
jgi:hypothetical protein